MILNPLFRKVLISGDDSWAEEAISEFLRRERAAFAPNVRLGEFTSDARSTVVSGVGSVMHISGFSGATEVHEMLPQIVGDHTLLGFEHSPKVKISENRSREFSDAMILGHSALLSIQAKGFDFEGDVPPTSRGNAEKRMRKNVQKAISQTRGSSRMLREGRSIFSGKNEIKISDKSDFIFCIFVPSLDLLSDEIDSMLKSLHGDLSKHNHAIVALDPMQLLRTLQASVHVSQSNNSVPDDMFFELIKQNSRESYSEGIYRRPIIYRW